jgi:hypothetical protein
MGFKHWLSKKIAHWLSKESKAEDFLACDFNQLSTEIRPGDILLVEGHSRVSNIIRFLTQSSWTHAALCLGSHNNIKNSKLHEHLMNHYGGDKNEILLIEEYLGKGVVVTPLSKYRAKNLRICRPMKLMPDDTTRVLDYCVGRIGYDYNLRQIFDLMRLLLPITFLPRRLFSSLYRFSLDGNKKNVCSSLLAEAFHNVQFPILPKIITDENGEILMIPRNPNLFAPRDFDYSPYFEIIKSPLFGMNLRSVYHELPWAKPGIISNDDDGLFDISVTNRKKKIIIPKMGKEPRCETD